MGQLTDGVAHDFNNLLMIVTSAMDIILRSSGNPQKVEKFARASLEACSRGQRLIHSFSPSRAGRQPSR